ncbi:hypothetical protein R1flu_027179 [Riccia fluitans]|uniref:Uncharacterized protein n=1 Tax=Riccia fluitans TaxID=41844 RepID=A0ABD1XL35_9MARC
MKVNLQSRPTYSREEALRLHWRGLISVRQGKQEASPMEANRSPPLAKRKKMKNHVATASPPLGEDFANGGETTKPGIAKDGSPMEAKTW